MSTQLLVAFAMIFGGRTKCLGNLRTACTADTSQRLPSIISNKGCTSFAAPF